MSTYERRKKPRNQDDLTEAAYVEIRHTFGPVRKSVYKVLEFNEHGTSFLVPRSDGYFSPGFPMEYSLVKHDFSKVEHYGVVRYYHPFNDHQGGAFYKIGVENNKLNAKPPSSFAIRPERVRLADMETEHAIFFTIDEQSFALPLIDISRYSAAFFCDEENALELRVSTVVENADILFGQRMIFQGTVVITRRDEEQDGYRIVIEPRGAIFDIDVIEKQEALSSVAREVDALIHTTDQYRTIDASFKTVISDLRVFLEGYRKILDSPSANKLSDEIGQANYLDELNKVFYPKVDNYWKILDNIVCSLNLSIQEQGSHRSYAQDHLHPLLFASPICHRIYFKPLGYPGDYEMMRMIHENRYDGPTLFSKLVHKYALENPLASANRNRVDILARRIAEYAQECGERPVRLLSIASGPALEIQKLIEEYPEIANRVHITLLDQEAEALRYSQDAIYMKRIMNNCSIDVQLIHQNIGTFLKQLARNKILFAPFDLIYIFGLFDYFDDRACSFCINKSATLLTEEGRMIISNYSLDGHHHQTFMEYAFEWFMVYRSRKQMENLGRSSAKCCSVRVDEDPTGVIKFLELQFGGAVD